MTIIHLENRNTSDEIDFNAQKSSQASLLLVNKEATVERFSLELTVGAAWAKIFSPTQKSFVKIDSDGIRIGRHDSIVIETAEEIHMPNNMYGILMPTGSLFLGLGILIAPAKIEPGFSGKLTLRLFNTTAEKHILKAGQKLGSAIFFPTDTTVEHKILRRERDSAIKKYSRSTRIVQWCKENPVTIATLLINIIGSSTAAVVISLYVASQQSNSSQKQSTSMQQPLDRPKLVNTP